MLNLRSLVVLSTIALAPAIASAQTPQTYSFALTMGGGLTVQVARDASMELVEQTVPPGPNGPGMRIRSLYDLAAHKVWTVNLDGGPCSVVAYTSPEVPSMFDPVAGAKEMQAGLAQKKPAVLRSETVNGIATKVYEMPFAEVKGKMRMFLDAERAFAVKLVMVGADGSERTQMEITRLSWAKPAADLFAPPQGCEQVAGETNATGGHVEMNVGGGARGAVKPVPADPAQKAAPIPSPAAAPSPSENPAPSVAALADIEVRGAGVSPVTYTGPSPASFTFSFSIEASGPVEAQWVLVSQADTAWESGTIIFQAAGTKELSVPVKIGVANGTHWEGAGHLELVVGARRVLSTEVKVSADCKAK